MLVTTKDVLNEDGSIGYTEAIFESDNILKTTYFPAAQRLYIAFRRGETYSYGNVAPELYEQFENAESQGKFFHQKINNKSTHPTRKEFTLYPHEVNDAKKIIEENKDKFCEDEDE
jgi:hypothetical protein